MRPFTDEELKELPDILDRTGCSEEQKKEVLSSQVKVKTNAEILEERELKDAELLGGLLLEALDEGSGAYKDFKKLKKEDYERILLRDYKSGEYIKRMVEQIRAYKFILKEAGVSYILQRESSKPNKTDKS